jgi:GNAT superfamily N-acetyltransferase
LFSAVSRPDDDRATKMKDLVVRPLESRDVDPISAAFGAVGWNKPRSHIASYLSEQQRGLRTVFVALVGGGFAGYVTINWSPAYPPFRAGKVPEIQDFNVLPRFRRQGIGTSLMDRAEQKISERSGVAGIGVGMPPDYGAAQRLYALRGYVPDGKGLTRDGSPVRQGDEITVNDGLVLYLTKTLASEPSPK